MVYGALKGYLKDLKENGEIFWLRSRNESEKGLEQPVVKSGISFIRKEIEKRYKTPIVAIVDDLSSSGGTIFTLGKGLMKDQKRVVGLPLIGNGYTFIMAQGPNRKKLRIGDYSLARKLFMQYLQESGRKSQEKWIRKLRKKPYIAPSTLLFAPVGNTFSHLLGDTLEEYFFLDQKYSPGEKYLDLASQLSQGLARNFTEPLETEGLPKTGKYIVIAPRSR